VGCPRRRRAIAGSGSVLGSFSGHWRRCGYHLEPGMRDRHAGPRTASSFRPPIKKLDLRWRKPRCVPARQRPREKEGSKTEKNRRSEADLFRNPPFLAARRSRQGSVRAGVVFWSQLPRRRLFSGPPAWCNAQPDSQQTPHEGHFLRDPRLLCPAAEGCPRSATGHVQAGGWWNHKQVQATVWLRPAWAPPCP